MQDLYPIAKLESGYDTDLADSLNNDLDETNDYVFVYVLQDGVYLAQWTDDNEQWRFEGTFEDIGEDHYLATDNLSEELDEWIFVDVPGLDYERAVYTEA